RLLVCTTLLAVSELGVSGVPSERRGLNALASNNELGVSGVPSERRGLNQAAATAALGMPEQFFGFNIGADDKLGRWDRIVEYMKLAAQSSDRVRYRDLGKTSSGNPFVVLEIAAPETLKSLDRYKSLERALYFQGGAPSDARRDEIFREGKVFVLVT